ncbi:hypothetical protein HAX54_012161 [Datura stramonium]|uniref:Uncharacterized protein n=1 Tax=Datura stramonium TaxID=4076 RepID=A0ABS8TJ85_DATST|nr:hypothetical protein [Datura stramonium]
MDMSLLDLSFGISFILKLQQPFPGKIGVDHQKSAEPPLDRIVPPKHSFLGGDVGFYVRFAGVTIPTPAIEESVLEEWFAFVSWLDLGITGLYAVKEPFKLGMEVAGKIPFEIYDYLVDAGCGGEEDV